MTFDLFWAEYPLKKGKGAARKKFETLKKKKILPPTENLIRAIHNQQKEKNYLRSKNEFVPPWKHPATWLNQECWDDACILPYQRPKPKKKAYTIDTLHRAYNVLRQFGHDKFEEFCDGVGLKPEDKEAVINKYIGKFPEVRKIFTAKGI